jgi:hypothetical protein
VPSALVASVVLGPAWWVVGLEPFSVGATVAVLGLGAAAMVVGAAGPSSPAPAPPARSGAGWWLGPLAALAAWELVAYRSAPRADHPTLSSLANAMLEPRPVRAVALAAWLLAAWGLARR